MCKSEALLTSALRRPRLVLPFHVLANQQPEAQTEGFQDVQVPTHRADCAHSAKASHVAPRMALARYCAEAHPVQLRHVNRGRRTRKTSCDLVLAENGFR